MSNVEIVSVLRRAMKPVKMKRSLDIRFEIQARRPKMLI